MTGDERLKILADALEADAVNPTGMKFSLSSWLRCKRWPTGTPAQDCGTVGCAVGLAMMLPELQAEGLLTGVSYAGANYPMCHDPKSGCTYVEFSAVGLFFDISCDERNRLFQPFSYQVLDGAEAELAVASRIRSLIATPKSERDAFVNAGL